MKKKLITMLGASALMSATIVPNAAAGQMNWNYTKSCVQGSVFTQAYGDYTITHSVLAGRWYEKVFPSTGTTKRTTTYYTGQKVTTAAKVSNVGSLSRGVYNCED